MVCSLNVQNTGGNSDGADYRDIFMPIPRPGFETTGDIYVLGPVHKHRNIAGSIPEPAMHGA